MDTKQDEALKADVDPNNIPESPAEETKVSEVETPVEEVATEPTPETETEDKKSASYRIKELNEEKKAAEARAKSLEDKMAELTGRVPTAVQPQYQPSFEQQVPEPTDGEYINPDQFKRDILRDAQTSFELQLARERNLDRINSEAQKTVKKYSQLNPDSDEFDKDLSDAVGEATVSYLKANPLGSVPKFVDKMMKPYLRSIDNEVGQQRETLTKQVSQGALKPTQVPKGEKPFEELSLKEMEERLGGVSH